LSVVRSTAAQAPSSKACQRSSVTNRRHEGVESGSGAAAEVGGLHLLALEEGFAGPGQDDGAGLEHVTAVGALQGLAGILLHEEDGALLPLEVPDDAKHL